jgi:hypothetical protein
MINIKMRTLNLLSELIEPKAGMAIDKGAIISSNIDKIASQLLTERFSLNSISFIHLFN